MARPIRSPPPTPRNFPGSISTALSRAVSGTTYPRRRRVLLPRRSSMSINSNRVTKVTVPTLLAAAVATLSVVVLAAAGDAVPENASPIYGVTIPQGYRQWELIAPAQEAEPLNELRAVLGNAA